MSINGKLSLTIAAGLVIFVGIYAYNYFSCVRTCKSLGLSHSQSVTACDRFHI